jgi:hypothetical protein
MVLPMKMKIDTPARIASVTLVEGETQVDLAGLDVFIRRAVEEPIGLWAIEVIVPPSDTNGDELRKRGFVVSGNVCVDTVTSLKLRKNLQSPAFADQQPRSIFFNPDLATSAPVLQPTREEREAHANLNASLERRYSDNAVNRRLAAIEQDADKFKQIREGDCEIQAKAQRLAQAIIAGIERKPEKVE